MIADVRFQLRRIPFVSFTIRSSDGCDYLVPTISHAYITPRGDRVVIATQNGSVAILRPLHIKGIIEGSNGA